MQYLVYRKSDGYCLDCVVWDGIVPINIYPDYDLVLIPENIFPIPTIKWWYINNTFIEPSPYPSWILDENYQWQPPTPYPDDENSYYWDEDSKQWILNT